MNGRVAGVCRGIASTEQGTRNGTTSRQSPLHGAGMSSAQVLSYMRTGRVSNPTRTEQLLNGFQLYVCT